MDNDRFKQIFVRYHDTPANIFLYSPNLYIRLQIDIVRKSYIRITPGNEKIQDEGRYFSMHCITTQASQQNLSFKVLSHLLIQENKTE